MCPGTGHCFLVGTTLPIPHNLSVRVGFAAEGASVLGVLSDISFLHHVLEQSIIMGIALTNSAGLCGFSQAAAMQKNDQRLLVFHAEPNVHPEFI